MRSEEAVLVVDDDARVASTLSDFLAGEGYTVALAHTGAEGLRRIREGGVGLVLLDLRLPDMKGDAVMREAQLDPAPPEFIIVTGHPTLASAIDALEASAAGFLPKPVDFQRLGTLVGRAFERRRLMRENGRLQREVADRLVESETLAAVAATVSSTLDLREALRRVCRELARLLGAETASVYLLDPATDQLVPTAAYHVPKEHLATLATTTLPLREQGFYAPLWQDRRPVYSDDVARDPRFTHELFRMFRHQSGLILPLALDAEVLGAFYMVWWTARRSFSARELQLLDRVAAQAGLLLRNARLYEQAGRNQRRLEVLNEVSRRLAAVHEREEVLALIVDEAARLLNAEAAGIRLLDGNDLVVAARTESAAALMARPRIRVGESLTGRVVSTGEPIVVEDLVSDTAYDPAHKQGAVARGFRGFVGVPLKSRGRILGALNIYTKGARHFLPDETALLAALADQASTAIEKARLFRETEEGQRRLAQIFDSTSDGIVLVSRSGEIQAANRRAGALLGFNADEVVGRALAELLAGYRSSVPDADRVFAALHALLEDPDRGGEGDLELRRAGRIVHWTGQATHDAAGRATGLTLTLRDVTQEREVSQMKTDFVSFVTHQLRTPLAGIKWMLELAGQAPDLPAEPASYAQDARAAAERLINLVNDLLDVSRLESGKLTVTPQPVSLGHLTRSVLDDLATLVREKGHRVSVTGAAAVPAVMADAQLLRQAILNLTANAIKYTPAGGEVAIQMAVEDGAVRWAITDNGIGIPNAAQARLFEKFYRADNAHTVETEGTGLGLYLVRLIVEKFAGQVWCESDEGDGATFILTLPVPGRGQ